ncbi:MAG: tripartite tricarboxylate transporter permease [Chloroflexota bacterium]
MNDSILLLYALAGAVLASLLACVPALHIYNVAGLLILLGAGATDFLSPEATAFLFLGLVTGYAVVNTVPGVFFAAPDDSTLFVILPAQKYLMQRRGYEAVVLTGLGSLGGIVVLALLAPFASRLLPPLQAILQPHVPWILAAVIAYMLMSEWPKGTDRAPTAWGKLAEAWVSLAAGLITFLLAGLLGLILMYRSPVPVDMAYQGLLPAFVGLFAVPWIVQNLLARIEIPPQHLSASVDVTPGQVARGVAAGAMGGLFAAFFPVVTGGIGGFLAGHATAQRDDRLFLISQGASKVVYYVGGLLLFFVPGLHLTRGGMAWTLSTLFSAHGPTWHLLATAAVMLAGGAAFFLLLGLSRGIIVLMKRWRYRSVSLATLGLLLTVVLGLTGPGGLLVCVAASGIGLIPVLWGSRRMNCMGVLLLPITLNMFGASNTVAGWLGLL